MIFDQTIVIAACAFLGVLLLVGYVVYLMERKAREGGKLRERLTQNATDAPAPPKVEGKGKLGALLQRVGEAASQPFMPSTREKQSGLRHFRWVEPGFIRRRRPVPSSDPR